MKATVSKNNRFIQITPRPISHTRNGLKVFYERDIDESKATDKPIIATDIIEGKIRYYLPQGFNNVITDIVVLEERSDA